MKKLLALAPALMLAASSVFAAPFSPTLLKLSAPANIHYAFDGKDLQIPLTVSGTPANVSFFVYTKDKASQIGNIRNGYLGWHYVNKIDTCLYMSQPLQFDKGTGVVNWNGRDDDGNLVPAGDYTYYFWGFDNISGRVRVTHGWNPYYDTSIVQFGGNGAPLANPIIYRPSSRWTIGTDPADSTLFETTSFKLPSGWSQLRTTAFHPGDLSMFYLEAHNKDAKTQGIWKYQWVPGGESVLQTGWAEEGKVTFSNPHYQGPGVVTDGEYLYTAYYGQYLDGSNINLYKVDFDGSILNTWSLADWLAHPEDYAAGAQMSGGPSYMPERNGKLFLNHFGSCLKAMVNPSVENPEDLFEWVNQNGDYIADHNFDPAAKTPWVCFDFNQAPYNYTYSPDENLFTITPAYDMGAVSFALLAPDGTGVNYFSFAGETASWKTGQLFVDNGSAFDGIYCDNVSSSGLDLDNSVKLKSGVWFVGHDSIKGSIGSSVSVKDAAPATFTVKQNTPNPFNPTTTISFTLAKAGFTTVEVFNAAGQRVDTIVNGSLSAGSHSVTWNAAKFSAGVYFYTVRSGNHFQTMKMTLLK